MKTAGRKCPDCIRKWHKEWATRRRRAKGMPLRTEPIRMAANKEKKRLKSLVRLKWLEEKMRAEEPDRLREIRRQGAARWKKENPSKYLALRSRCDARRRAMVRQATPGWGQDCIGDVYLEARYMQMEVDHIVPLRNKLVCGLHVWDNLRIIPKPENRAKRNYFDPMTFNP